MKFLFYFSDLIYEMGKVGASRWMWKNRKYERIEDASCKSGRRVVDGSQKGRCMQKRKCKLRWSRKRGRCTMFPKSK